MTESMYCRVCAKRNPIYELDTCDGQYWCIECGDYSIAPLSQHFDKLNELLENYYNNTIESADRTRREEED